jgi:aspartokinase
MTDPEKLGGFKVLKEAVLLSPAPFEPDRRLPVSLFRVLAEHEINLPYVTCVLENTGRWQVSMAVDFKDARTAGRLLSETLGKRPHQQSNAAILSIFPHRKKPAITGAVFEAFVREGIHPKAMAHSPSAISVVLEEQHLLQASSSLFGPFAFGAYRTPADWKLAQKGKEKLFKEVVANYQEKHPKIYGLEYQDHQELFHIALAPSNMSALGAAFKGVTPHGLDLTFLVSSRSRGKSDAMHLCLPLTRRGSNKENIAHILDPLRIETDDPVGTFSMNGPHFGDRYGIVRDLLNTLETAGVDLMGLSCTIASITGVVPSSQLSWTIEAIQNCFDVPSILKTDREYE